LARSNLWTWFTPKGKLRPNYLQIAQGTIVKHLKQHLPILEKYPTLWDDLVTMLQKMISVGQQTTLSTRCCSFYAIKSNNSTYKKTKNLYG
jgi:hypothetical protein